MSERIGELFPEFPEGPLTPYRKRSSFDWRKIKLSIYDEEQIRIKRKIWDKFESSELFRPSRKQLSLDEQRHLAWKRVQFIKRNNFLPMRDYTKIKLFSAINEATYSCDVESTLKCEIIYLMFTHAVQNLGTEEHQKYVERIWNDEIIGCFALTEIAHGSNAQGLQTTATYEPETKEFVLNSKDFTAAKCWAGALGQCATHGVVYAKLITPDGKDQGLHGFIVPIRCTRTLRAFPGVTIGDMGPKIAFNGLDNGFMLFNAYRVPKNALLNRLGGIDDAGNYTSCIPDPKKRFGASLGTLSAGRVTISHVSVANLQRAITIALRYSAVRKQFGPDDSEEYSIIEYQQHQLRLIPYLSAAYGCRIFINWFGEMYHTYAYESSKGTVNPDKGMEIHALSSGIKATMSWIARDCIQICREACGGHGYLEAAELGKIRNENDVNCTYEGENTVLIQQTSNWLLACFQGIRKGRKLTAPYGSDYINDYKNILNDGAGVNSTEATNPRFLLKTYKWLVCYTLKLTADKVEKLKTEGLNAFDVKNNSQSYHAASLSIIYSEHAILNAAYNHAINVEDPKCRDVLVKLVSLFGTWSLEKHIGTLYTGGYFSGDNGQYLRNGILELCHDLKPECISLVDVIAPPDFILNSVLGNSDGKVYEHLKNTLFSNPEALTRPNWWRDVVKSDKSKL